MNQSVTPILEIRNLEKRYDGKSIINNLSFLVNPGEVVGLLGCNGAGKTTAFHITMGLISPESGQVIFSGKDITKLDIHLRAQMGMGYLAQEPSVFRNLTVKENLLCILETLPLTYREQQRKICELLDELHLTPLSKKKAKNLSGGERRRLEITRALITNPKLLLLDEPFANIDPLTISDVKQLIELLKKRGISILITDHNARELVTIVDRSYLLQNGRVLISGNVQQLLESEVAKQSYFGRDFTL